jgi:hypothetical protein
VLSLVVMVMVGDDVGVHRARGTPSPSVVNGPGQLPPKTVVISVILSLVLVYRRKLSAFTKRDELSSYICHKLSQHSVGITVLGLEEFLGWARTIPMQRWLKSSLLKGSDEELPSCVVLDCFSKLCLDGFIDSASKESAASSYETVVSCH